MSDASIETSIRPDILPLGDAALLVRFGAVLDDSANQAALALAERLRDDPIAGVVEVVPSLISVLLRYDPRAADFPRLAGEVRLRLGGVRTAAVPREHVIKARFGDEAGPDLVEVAALLQLDPQGFVDAHCAIPLRVLTTGFAPGFVYCGFHRESLVLPRRREVRREVPIGSILFAAGQTAITATEVPTGWHVIGRTEFRNFDPRFWPPTTMMAGDTVSFEVDA